MLWEQKNKPSNLMFRVIRSELTAMCQGGNRCAYCEDAPADEIEHFKPKSIFPSQCFVWENYLYACGICNLAKSNQFAVFPGLQADFIEIPKNWAETNDDEPTGDPSLINPRAENPLDFLFLDIQHKSFHFAPLPDEIQDPQGFKKAEYTAKVLKLNDRDYLVSARRNAYTALKAMLENYVRNREADPTAASTIYSTITTFNHQTVWQEMKRQKDFIPALRPLFESAPEALWW
jgi:uncharacterized protein (TIGR02646 family)